MERRIPGLTGTVVPHWLGTKRIRKIRKLSVSLKDDVHQYLVSPQTKKVSKLMTKAPKIQHLVTPHVLKHKYLRTALKKQG